MGVFGNTFGNSLGGKGAVIRRFSNPSAMYVELTFDSVPTVDVTKAPLLYDKKVAFSMRYDDTYRSAYTNSLALFMGGEFYADENGVEHAGYRYTDGCGFEMPYVADFACQCGALNSNTNIYISWEDALEAKNYGYGILPQGCYISYAPTVTSVDGIETFHSPYSEWYNDYVEFRQLCYSNLGFKPFVATSDIGYKYWASILDGEVYKAPFFDAGMFFITSGDNPKEIAGVNKSLDLTNGLDVEAINSESFNFGQPYPCLYHSKRIIKVTELPASGELYYIYMLPNYTMYRWDGTTFNVTTESTAGSVPLSDIKQSITNAINDPKARALSIFTHRLDYTISQNDNGGMYLPYFKTEILEWLDQNYGKNGTDQILMASMNTVAEYIYCRELSSINTYREGNKLILEIIPPINTDLRRPSLTLKLNTNIPVTGVLINNIDRFSQNVLNNTSGIINLEWSSEYYEVANNYVTIAENVRTINSVEKAEYFMQFVTNPTKLNSLQTRINNIVVLTDLRHIVDFGRTLYPSDSPPYNNVSSSDYDISTYLPTNIALRDISNGNYGIKIDIIQAFSAMTYSGMNTGDNSGIYLDTALRDSFDVFADSPAIMKLHGLLPGQVVDFKFMSSKANNSGRISRFTVANQIDNSTTFSNFVIQDGLNNISNTVEVKNGFANQLGEIFITVSCEGAATIAHLNVMDFTVRDTIISPQFILQSVLINDGDLTTSSRDVDVTLNFTGEATHYMISESSTFSGASWISYLGVTGGTAPFNLSDLDGDKIIYVKLKNSENVISNILNTNIALALAGSKVVVSFAHTSYSTSYYRDLNGETINFMTWNRTETYADFPLKSTTGVEKGKFVVKPSEIPTDTTIKLFALGGTPPSISGNTGPYPDEYLIRFFYPQSVNISGNKALLRFKDFAQGTYTVRILSCSNTAITPVNQAKLFYQGNSGTPVVYAPQNTQNTTVFTELPNVIVASDGLLDIYCFNTGGIFSAPGFNLVEIIKTA